MQKKLEDDYCLLGVDDNGQIIEETMDESKKTSGKGKKNSNKTTSTPTTRVVSPGDPQGAGSVNSYAQKLAKNDKTIAPENPASKSEVAFDDGGMSEKILKSIDKHRDSSNNWVNGYVDFSEPRQNGNYSNMAKSLAHYMHLPAPGETYHDRMYDSIFRFGAFNTNTFTTGREFLFFTRPDLNIFKTSDDDNSIIIGESKLPELNPGLKNGFWQDIASSKTRIVAQLQNAYAKYLVGNSGGVYDPICHLLSNQCISNLDIPSLSASVVETSTNMYGVSFAYRGSSEESDDQVEFSLEFKDTRWLDIYYYFKCYEEYETEKHHGTVRPYLGYITNKIIHDQICIYKFIVDDDMETLVYWGKFFGVMPMSLPRDTFSTDNFENGLSYTINFKAAFYEDMRPEILSEFNGLTQQYWSHFSGKKGYDIGIYNPVYGRTDGRWPKAAHILYVDGTNGNDAKAFRSPNKYRYKLAWRGDTKV